MYRNAVERIDSSIIHSLRRISFPFARFSIFVVFFWFGILKVFNVSPASPLVLDLLHKTLPFIDPNLFLRGFGIYEMIIGIAFLIPHFEREAIALLVPHLFTTIMPLVLLSSLTWSGPFVPTMEGQYIIKNILILALAIGVAAHLRPKRV
jgi:uncharacterized membrane protein YkgB